MYSTFKLAITLACFGSTLAAGVGIAADDPAGLDFFEKKVRPVLVKHCYECHSAEAKKLGGKLLLDSRDGVRKGGESGQIVVPGKPEKSPLIAAVRYENSLQMPPSGKLSAAEIADLETWVKLGAPDPRDKPTVASATATWDEILRTRRDWWSLKPVVKPSVPTVKNSAWSRDPVDRFVLAELEEIGLTPAAPADARTLARRLSLVLTGLPPTPEQTAAFVNECQTRERETEGGLPPRAVEQLVDKLLDSPHFGERWARHWLDVVRFSETHGNEWNYEVHHAWRYRDYVIRAFNADLPYDRFVREHIAGDMLPPRWNERERFNEAPIGTAFYRFGEVNHDDCISLRQLGYDILDNQLDTLTKAFQATTVACARCHDHKLDAVSTHDYYGLLGILRSSRLVSHTLDDPKASEETLARLAAIKSEIRQELAAVWTRDAVSISTYLQAATADYASRPSAAKLSEGLDATKFEKWIAALKVEKAPQEDPLEPLRALARVDEDSLVIEWRKLRERYAAELRSRETFNRERFQTYADFRANESGWQVGGLGLKKGALPSGEFAVSPAGELILSAVLPAGTFTHSLSELQNGTLRSPVLPPGKKYISLHVMGKRSSAARLVSNNCQLNYKNYKALTSDEPGWITFPIPEDAATLRVYAELMTMLDNPKFPDQLSALGGDASNYRLPWHKAAANPRSFFGITRAVLHDSPEPPMPVLSHLRPLLAGPEPKTHANLAELYEAVISAAIEDWANGKATDDDVRWLDVCVRRGLLSTAVTTSPRLALLTATYRQVEGELDSPRIVPGVADFGHGVEQPIFTRGDALRPGRAVPRRYLEVLANSRAPFATQGSGRLELAEQLARPDNPLTVRVMVNRVWQHLFGVGLVSTVDDFGHVGELPSHPELLDYLAARFMEEGWSLKRLIRSLVLTRTFGQSAVANEAGRLTDPLNRRLSHFPARRLEAEAIRDSLLAVSGRLDRSLYGPSIQPFREKEYADRRLFPGPLDGHGRRSVYIKNNLMESPRFLGAFNTPGGKVAQGRRDVTNVPAQALALLNDSFVLGQARFWGERLIARPDETAAQRLTAMFEQALNRPPSETELARFVDLAQQLAELHTVPPKDSLQSLAVWRDVAHAFFNLQEFVYVP